MPETRDKAGDGGRFEPLDRALFDAETQWADQPLDVSPADDLPLDRSELLTASFLRRGSPVYAYWLPAELPGTGFSRQHGGT